MQIHIGNTAPTTTVAVMLFVSLMIVGESKSSDLIEAHLIFSVVTVVPRGCVYLADTQQSYRKHLEGDHPQCH